jgi:hypothetical protein
MNEFLAGVEVFSVFAMCLGASMTIAFGILHTIIRLASGRQYNEANVQDAPDALYVASRRTLSGSWLRNHNRNLASR